MRIPSTALFLVLFTAACGSSSSGGMPPSSMDGAAGAGSAESGAGGAEGNGVVTYQDVKPLFMSKCTPCHSAGGIAANVHTLADSYDSAKMPSKGSCPGKTIGECTLVMVKMGFMPYEKKCTGDPAKDVANSACLTAAEQQLLADWIAGGLRER